MLPAGVQVTGTPTGDSDVLLAKVNGGDGTAAWARAFGDDGHRQTIRKVAANNDGVVGFFGEFDGTIDLGAGVMVGPPVAPPADQRPPFWTGTFLAGVRSSDGSGVFAVILGFTTGGLVDMAASPVDNSFVLCGRSAPYTLEPARDIDAYVAKFNGRGQPLWNASAALATSERDSCEAVAVLDDGDVVIGGLHGYGPTRALWFAKLDGSTGARIWSRTFGLTDRIRPPSSPDVAIAVVNDIAADASGDLAFAGTLYGQVVFGGGVGTLVVPGAENHETFSSDAMVVKLDGDSGEPLWGRLFGDPGTGVVPWEEATNIAFDSRGDVHATGNTRTPEPAASGYHDLFQLKLGGQDGSTLCTRSFGGEQNQTSGELVINRRGAGSARDQAVLLGWFNTVIDFGGESTLRTPFGLAYFLTRFQP